ncbi:MAG: HMA2 domain-containing protein [Nitrospiria bacterium]
MLPEAFITHFISGRVRIKIPSKKGDDAYFLSIKERFSGLPGVQKIEINSLTGSILILHTFDPESLDVKELKAYTELNSLFRLEGGGPGPNRPSLKIRKRFGETFQGLNQKMKDLTNEEIDLPTLAFMLLLGIGIYQIGAGNFAAPAWYVAFWYAMNIFLQAETRKAS